MKRIIFISLLLMTTAIASAQTKSESKIRLNAYGLYVFDDGFDVYNDVSNYYNGKIEGGLKWGASIEFLPYQDYSIELTYLNKNSDAPATFKFGATEPKRSENFDLSQSYILLGANRLQKSNNGKVEGFGGLMGGILISDVKSPSTGKSGSNTNFAFGGKLGVNIWLSQKVGIKLQSQLLTASKVTGGDLYFSYYGPVFLNSYSTMWQFGLGGGLTFKLGK